MNDQAILNKYMHVYTVHGNYINILVQDNNYIHDGACNALRSQQIIIILIINLSICDMHLYGAGGHQKPSDPSTKVSLLCKV